MKGNSKFIVAQDTTYCQRQSSLEACFLSVSKARTNRFLIAEMYIYIVY